MSGVLPANLSTISTCVVCVAGLGELRTCDLLDLAGLAVEGWRPVRDFYARGMSTTSRLRSSASKGSNCRAMAC